jgi:hypothetical protein
MKTFNIKGNKTNPKYTILVFDGTSERSLENFPDIVSAFSPSDESNNILEFYSSDQPTQTQFFTALKPGKGYCIQSKSDITIQTDGSEADKIPSAIFLSSTIANTSSWHIIKYPFTVSVKISNYPFIEKVQRASVSTDSATLETYDKSSVGTRDFNTLDPNVSYIIQISKSGKIVDPNRTDSFNTDLAILSNTTNALLQHSTKRPTTSWSSPKINFWVDANLHEQLPLTEILTNKNKQGNILFSSLLPSYGNNINVLKNKVNVYKFTDQRSLAYLGYDSDNRSKTINLVFTKRFESVYFFNETPQTPTFSYYEDICNTRVADSDRIFGKLFCFETEHTINTQEFFSLAENGSRAEFDTLNNLKNTNFNLTLMSSDCTVLSVVDIIIQTLKSFDFITLAPTIKTIAVGNCFNDCHFGQSVFNPNEIITNKQTAQNTIARSFDVDQIGFLKPFAEANRKTNFVDVTLYDNQKFSFAITNGSNGSWLVRRNNDTSQWTLVGFLGASIEDSASCVGFALSDKSFMRWGSDLNFACRWEHLLHSDFNSPIVSFNKTPFYYK